MDSQYRIIHPIKYLRDYLERDIRPDGRQFLRVRPMSVNVRSITQADSSSIFKIGNTTVVCGIKAELAEPKVETPDCGYIIPNVELPPLCSPKFRPGPPSDQAQISSKIVETVFLNSGVLDPRNLCISKNKLVWVLYCDLICIDYDGSVMDACVGALMAALKTLTLPEVEHNPDTGAIIVHPSKRLSVPLKGAPVCTTFALFEDQLLIPDPTEEEESLALARLSLVIDGEELCGVYKAGGIPISQEVLMKSLSQSKKRAELVRKLIDTAISST
ncbi:exosome complex component RRP43 isoform X2 [Cephus cinctus]|uniref:Ribosomal RNA-processing protein 43 n=1 Tax=Cephus cinctus TaxID=211228 RepID=A0AAJ7BY60_CEPCN|nr:exosome complex component RRP43 isoform X2 [Cephus cinctus]